ncbi:MAG: class I SAM-dependent methyltransferase [Verrucomicrobiales bacterium]|nr:class I SAM-dependent methyltransferase [Verrucomicrobiales bacterium]
MTAPSPNPTVTCHLCGSPDLELSVAYPSFHRVTSDCKAWAPGGGLARCRTCGLVQTTVSPAWSAEADRIYQSYTIYHQSGGTEQRVFDGRGGAGRPRSEQIIDALRQAERLPERGRLLDIGCGNGGFLSAWSRLIPGWTLAGTEFDAKYQREVESIPGFERLHFGEVKDIPGTFDVITLIHVLEHIPSPLGLLQQLRDKLNPGGLLLVEVPDCGQNVFMLLVADHCSHFSPPLLAGVVAASGLQVTQATNTWVTKEVSVVARRIDSPASCAAAGTSAIRLPAAESARVFAGERELARIVERVTPLLGRAQFGLFGTAIAATWLDAQTGGAARFFVDEDLNRTGKTHFGRPILAPQDVPCGAAVFVALPPVLSGPVSQRLRALGRDLEVVVP